MLLFLFFISICYGGKICDINCNPGEFYVGYGYVGSKSVCGFCTKLKTWKGRGTPMPPIDRFKYIRDKNHDFILDSKGRWTAIEMEPGEVYWYEIKKVKEQSDE